MLEIENLDKIYNGPDRVLRAVDDVSFHVKTGEFVAMQGASGSGKTTVLLCAGGLQAPDRGGVVIDGTDPYLMTPDERAQFRASNIGFVFQQFHLIPYLSVIDNVLAPSGALPDQNVDGRAQELIERFNMSARADHKPSELSTGEQQRTAMARALLNNPKLLLADEPTGNLDSGNAEIILDYMREFAEAGGAVLMVTHSEEAASYAHRTIHLANGKILASE
jgi:ABC-type lipoprotein export system ATPase subunit